MTIDLICQFCVNFKTTTGRFFNLIRHHKRAHRKHPPPTRQLPIDPPKIAWTKIRKNANQRDRRARLKKEDARQKVLQEETRQKEKEVASYKKRAADRKRSLEKEFSEKIAIYEINAIESLRTQWVGKCLLDNTPRNPFL
jgi:hypothetical protein